MYSQCLLIVWPWLYVHTYICMCMRVCVHKLYIHNISACKHCAHISGLYRSTKPWRTYTDRYFLPLSNTPYPVVLHPWRTIGNYSGAVSEKECPHKTVTELSISSRHFISAIHNQSTADFWNNCSRCGAEPPVLGSQMGIHDATRFSDLYSGR
jgi:hypothetical protein